MSQIALKRLNITLKADTWDQLQEETSRMERSSFIDHALRVYITHLRQKRLKQQLKNEAISHSKKDLQTLNEWFSVDRELLENKK